MAALNAPLTEAEVRAACCLLPRSTHPGTFGVCAAALRVLARTNSVGLQMLTTMCNSVLHHCDPALLTALLVPIPKCNPAHTVQQLRPLQIASVWYRLLMRVFVQRTPARLFSVSQHGFRRDHSTLTAAVEVQCACDVAPSPLHLIKVDIVKAYDHVAWPPLWEAMSTIGLSGPLYSLLQAATTQATVQLATDTLPRSFTPTRGLKQGCPYSPTLFNLLLSGLDSYLATVAPSSGVALPHRRARSVEYADDLLLLARTPAEAQLLLTATAQYLAHFGL